MSDSIVALSTARGRAAISVIRMSGEDAIDIAKKFFSPFPVQPNFLKVGKLKTEHFDEQAMCVYFAAPHSYTGENTVEFHCHGGTAVAQAVIETCLNNGAIMAQNGEFSKRAFINGKQNLTNAEGIIEMIEAETASAAKAGADLLENKLGKRITELQDRLLDIVSSCEAALDYPEEDLELPTVNSAKSILKDIVRDLDTLISTSTLGKVAKYGIDVAIVGKPNVGKSSLLNALLGTDRAIVSDIQGTTRDTLTESVNYRDIRFNFVDTAGLRDSSDVIEIEGVKRARKAADSADVVLNVTDDPSDRSVYPTIRPQVRIYNKSDLFDEPPCCVDSLTVSAKNGDVEIIKETLYEMFSAKDIDSSDLLITNERHLDCLKRGRQQLVCAITDCDVTTLDVVTNDVKRAWEILGEITGSNAQEDIIDRIYSKFCLGK